MFMSNYGLAALFWNEKMHFQKKAFPQIWGNPPESKFFISPDLGKFPQIWVFPDWIVPDSLDGMAH